MLVCADDAITNRLIVSRVDAMAIVILSAQRRLADEG